MGISITAHNHFVRNVGHCFMTQPSSMAYRAGLSQSTIATYAGWDVFWDASCNSPRYRGSNSDSGIEDWVAVGVGWEEVAGVSGCVVFSGALV